MIYHWFNGGHTCASKDLHDKIYHIQNSAFYGGDITDD